MIPLAMLHGLCTTKVNEIRSGLTGKVQKIDHNFPNPKNCDHKKSKGQKKINRYRHR